MTLTEDIVVRRLGCVAYQPTWQAMRDFTRARSETTPDELWLLEHPPVYTLGQGARAAAVANGIALVRTDRLTAIEGRWSLPSGAAPARTHGGFS